MDTSNKSFLLMLGVILLQVLNVCPEKRVLAISRTRISVVLDIAINKTMLSIVSYCETLVPVPILMQAILLFFQREHQ